MAAPPSLPPAPGYEYTRKFGELCKVLEAILVAKGAKKKTVLIKYWNSYHTDDYFPLMRLLLPELDKERQSYALKESTLAKMYVKILSLPDADADRLTKWRLPSSARRMGGHAANAGDFPVILEQVLENRCGRAGHDSLTIGQVNDKLNELNAARVDRDARQQILTYFVRNATPVENMWIVRIILKDLKIGIRHETMLKNYHPDGMDLYNMCNDLRKVCTDLSDPKVRLHSKNIMLGKPFKPMLAMRRSPEQVLKLSKRQDFWIETKYDGERCLVHKNGDAISIFSRNAKDYSDLYGKKLAPIIKANVRANRCILDGELLVWDRELLCFEPFGRLKTTALETQSSTKHLCYMVFDLLMLNDEHLVGLPLCERYTRLEAVLHPVPTKIEIVPHRVARTKEDIVASITSAIDTREEGIIIKLPNSEYVPGERKDKWFKIKPEYVDSLTDSLDLLILGGFYGTGKRRGGMLSHFLLGVSKTPTVPGQRPDKFLTFCKVGTGYTIAELHELANRLQGKWRDYDPNNPPLHLAGWRAQPGERPDVYIPPHLSVILQVQAAEIVPSDKYHAGFTLRFPRTDRIRHDKSWHECLTEEGLQTLIHQGLVGTARGTKRTAADAGGTLPGSKKRRKAADSVPGVSLQRGKAKVSERFRDTDTSEVVVESRIFKKLEFCVLSAEEPRIKKNDLEKLIVKHGGMKTQNPTPSTDYIVAGKRILSVENQIRNGSKDIVSYKWLLECDRLGTLVPLKFEYLIFATPKTREQLHQFVDVYGDNFFEPTAESTLQSVFENVKFPQRIVPLRMVVDEDTYTTPPCTAWTDGTFEPAADAFSYVDYVLHGMEIDEQEYFAGTAGVTGCGLFIGCVFYLDFFVAIGDATSARSSSSLDMCANAITVFGGRVTNVLSDTRLTHIVIDTSDLSRLDAIKQILLAGRRRGQREKYVVQHSWVEECVKRRERIREAEYTL
eukprot:gnl/Spiro4/3110_TR1510_c0_g1_i1.p1 gnl/Spiro4/3110_TR1510_c0_g1~~gnl/Spiro4/3110_TR1510_c0_g1_i1.p1  ORF type:complete len:957 (-),score=239.75 gnl/Spiro4/3110_TR1510_c0_g1_i1:47-2917(-)